MANGTLYIVSTPIGNLKDITFRAVEILSSVDSIASEDTRHTMILLKKYNIYKPLISYYSQNRIQRAASLLQSLHNGKNVALVSDAGTPGISDPGFYLIRKAIDNGIPVIPVPGPSALLAGLVASGLPMDRFIFEGFLPAKKGRRKRLEELAKELRTIVLFEGPHRILKTLREIKEVMGDRKVVIAREITKIYEEFFRGTISKAIEHFSINKPRGEFVLLLGEHYLNADKD